MKYFQERRVNKKRFVFFIMMNVSTLFAMDCNEWEKLRPAISKQFATEEAKIKNLHKKLHNFIDQGNEASTHKFLLNLRNKKGGNFVSEVVSTAWSAYGTVLEATYIEGRPEIRDVLYQYVRDTCLNEIFNRRLEGLKKAKECNGDEFNKTYYCFWSKAIVFDLFFRQPHMFTVPREFLPLCKLAHDEIKK
jgi:hypothetical protein